MDINNKKIVPIRGSTEDWTGEKNDQLLQQKENYSKKRMIEKMKGSPDFEEYADVLKSEE